jgi:hypothetical protein
MDMGIDSVFSGRLPDATRNTTTLTASFLGLTMDVDEREPTSQPHVDGKNVRMTIEIRLRLTFPFM